VVVEEEIVEIARVDTDEEMAAVTRREALLVIITRASVVALVAVRVVAVRLVDLREILLVLVALLLEATTIGETTLSMVIAVDGK